MPPRLIATSDGAAIAVHDLGGQGPLALFTHGTGFCAAMLGPLAAQLSGRVRAFAVDSRAHGSSSSPPTGDMTRPRLATDIIEVAAELDPSGAGLIGIGHSSGAHSLLGAEARRPGTFTALYCYEPMFPAGLSRPPGAPSPNVERTLRRRDHFASREEARAHFSGRGSFATISAEALDAFVAGGIEEDPDGGFRLACRPKDEAGILSSPIQYDDGTDLSSIRCPLHLAYGETNEAGRRSVRYLAEIVPGASVTGLSGLGHLGPFEDPALVASWVAALEDVRRG